MTFAVILVVALAVLGLVALATRRLGMARSGRSTGESRASVSVTSEGVSAVDGRGTRMQVAWSGLVEVGILTTSDGPWGEDVYVVLKDERGQHCIVPHGLASELLKRVLRLPGFDHEKFIAAMGSTREAKFVCWTGRPGDGKVAVETPPDAVLPSG